MLKNKKKILMIPLIIVLLIILFFVIWIIIYPKWLTQPLDNVSEIHITSEFLDLKTTDQKMISKLYKLCNDTKIKKMEFDTSEMNSEMSDTIDISFVYKNNSSDTIICRKKDAIIKKQPRNALFWTRGDKNEELLSSLLEIENSENTQIIADQEQIFTDIEENLKEYEQDFDKIISLAKADKSAQKEEESGYISLTENALNSNNSDIEEHCLSLMKKTKISSVSFGKTHVSFDYNSNPNYLTSIEYNYKDDENEAELLGYVVKRIKPFYYMRCILIENK